MKAKEKPRKQKVQKINAAEKARRGKQASIDGFAHEHIAAGVLMKKYGNVSVVDLPLSSYDLIIVRTDKQGVETPIRCQVKRQ